MEIKYDAKTNTITCAKYSFDYYTGEKRGMGTWEAQPILVILCTCGTPLKAIFAGVPPVMNMDEYQIVGPRSGNSRKYLRHVLKHQGWMMTAIDTCPNWECRTKIYYGNTPEQAVEKYARHTMFKYTRLNYTANKTAVNRAVEKIKHNKTVQRFYNITTDTLSDRQDCALIVLDEIQREDRKLHTAIEYDVLRTGSREDNQEFWFTEEEEKHYELEDGILAAHGEECTCNLCMK